MGATSFHVIRHGSNLTEVYEQAKSEYTHEYGARYDSGTIAASCGTQLVQRSPLSLTAAQDLADQLMNSGPRKYTEPNSTAWAIPVVFEDREITVTEIDGSSREWSEPAAAVEAATKLLRQRKLLAKGEKVVSAYLTQREYNDAYSPKTAPFTRGVAKVRVQKPGPPLERIVKVKLTYPGPVSWMNRDAWVPLVDAKLKLSEGEEIASRCLPEFLGDALEQKVKVAASTSKTKPVTRYLVSAPQDSSIWNLMGGHDTWETGFDSQAAARTWATTEAKKAAAKGKPAGPIEITSVTRRADGSPLVQIDTAVTHTVVEVTVTIIRRPAPTEQPDGFLFFGYAKT